MAKSIFKIFPLLLFTFVTIEAQSFSENERILKSFPVGPETQIEVNNKYGKIYVKTWKKDSVRFEIDLNLSSNSLTRLHKVKNSIDFDFTSSKYYITASTDFGNTGNQIFAELKNLSDALITGKNSIEINYTIYCPEIVNLTLSNKFGDIYIDDLSGDIAINLANGDLKINSIRGKTQIELNFGNGIVNTLSEANMSVSYADMKIKKAEKLAITSKSSTLHIEEAGLLKLESRRDKYFITNTNSIFAVADFSQIWLEELSRDADLRLKFGAISIDNIAKGFSGVSAVSEYADISLGFDETTAFEADILHHKDVSLNLPTESHIIRRKQENISETEMHTFFQTRANEPLPLLKINASQKCYLNLNVK